MKLQAPDPKPGSHKAIECGCMCPVIDNGHGHGYMGDAAKFGWVINLRCPLHGREEEITDPLHSVARNTV